MVRLKFAAAAALIGLGLPGTGTAIAQTMNDASRLKMMMACDAIKEEAQRLTCYDSAVRSGRAALGGDKLGMRPGRPAAQPRTPDQQFGMTAQLERAKNLPSDRPLEVDEINAKVAAVVDRGAGMWGLTLANGARWQFTEGMVNFSPPRRGDEVRIRKGAIGSYLLYVGSQPSVRVMRVN